jgi:hypothetical protein
VLHPERQQEARNEVCKQPILAYFVHKLVSGCVLLWSDANQVANRIYLGADVLGALLALTSLSDININEDLNHLSQLAECPSVSQCPGPWVHGLFTGYALTCFMLTSTTTSSTSDIGEPDSL